MSQIKLTHDQLIMSLSKALYLDGYMLIRFVVNMSSLLPRSNFNYYLEIINDL